jgi:hypothetical protein
LEQALAALPFDDHYFFRPSILLGKREESRPGEEFGARLARAFERLMLGGLSIYRPMPAGLLASALAAAGERGPRGRHVFHYRDILQLAGSSA